MDLRVKKTYKSLVDAFEKLLLKDKYEHITISMLCAEAMIRRTTFYKHFDDKGSFFKFYMEQKRVELEQICCANDIYLSIGAYHVHMLDSLMAFLSSNERLVDNLMKSSQSGALLDTLADFMAGNLTQVFKEKEGELSKDVATELDYLGIAISGATIHSIKRWWTCGHDAKDCSRVVHVTSALLPLR